MEDWKKKAVFIRKVESISELREYSGYKNEQYARPFQVGKVVLLAEKDYQKFAEELGAYYRFLYDHHRDMYVDGKSECWHCLLIKGREGKEGILIEAEDYAYARYSALVPDCDILDLKGIEVIEDADISHDIPQEYWDKNNLKFGEAADEKKDKKKQDVER